MSEADFNTSATGGFLLDRPPPPPAEDIQHALQHMVTVLTDLPGHLVRPRWQPLPPAQPDALTDWVAIGVTRVEADD